MRDEAWQEAQVDTIEHYHRMLHAASARDLGALRRLAGEAHPICIASNAPAGGAAFGAWCEDCPLHRQYGGCHPLVERMLGDAAAGSWEAAQLLILTLIQEVVDMRPLP